MMMKEWAKLHRLKTIPITYPLSELGKNDCHLKKNLKKTLQLPYAFASFKISLDKRSLAGLCNFYSFCPPKFSNLSCFVIVIFKIAP